MSRIKYMVTNIKSICIVLIVILTNVNCTDDHNDSNNDDLLKYNLFIEEQDNVISNGITFPNTEANDVSSTKFFTLQGENLSSEIVISVTDYFQLSLNDIDFSKTITISSDKSINKTTIYVRFAPSKTITFDVNGTVNINNEQADDISFPIIGKAIRNGIINYLTFDKERVAFGGGYTQTSRKNFTLHDDLTNIESIKMYVKLTCPDVGCDQWDVFANVKITDPISGELYELGRFITPYWNDNSQLTRGFEFDVTDFKSILTGTVELRIRTECWNTKGYEVTVDFDYLEGIPDYPYYAVTRVFNYDNSSAAGVPYGIEHDKDLTRTITIPSNAESTHLRTYINGWGEANPSDNDGRRCAEWCYRTHTIKINSTDTFNHYLGPLGCASNPVNNQSPGNWMPDRAGWCPGMVVPIRIDEFSTLMTGSSFNFEYTFEDWTNDETKDSYYPISTFIVVKSNSVIIRPTVVD